MKKFKIADTEILKATFIYCSSNIRWDGVSFKIEGLENTTDKTTNKFAIGKIDYSPIEIRKIDRLALAIDRMFEQMCSSTIALDENPRALAEYVIERDKTALKLFNILSKFENITQSDSSNEEKLNNQEKLLKEVIE